MFELIIFDCDGTLVDSELMHSHTSALALQEVGLHRYTTDYCLEHFVGMSLLEMCEVIGKETGITLDPLPLAARIAELREGEHGQTLQAIEGVAELLSELTLPRCVASNGEWDAIHDSLHHTGLAHFFETAHIFSYRQAGKPKPAPDLFLYAARQFGIAPSSCLVIEDSSLGIHAAKAAGMKVALTLCGNHMLPSRIENLKALQPDYVIENFLQLADIMPKASAP